MQEEQFGIMREEEDPCLDLGLGLGLANTAFQPPQPVAKRGTYLRLQNGYIYVGQQRSEGLKLEVPGILPHLSKNDILPVSYKETDQLCLSLSIRVTSSAATETSARKPVADASMKVKNKGPAVNNQKNPSVDPSSISSTTSSLSLISSSSSGSSSLNHHEGNEAESMKKKQKKRNSKNDNGNKSSIPFDDHNCDHYNNHPKKSIRASDNNEMIAAGCACCLMYVLMCKGDPKCPKCGGTALLNLNPILPPHNNNNNNNNVSICSTEEKNAIISSPAAPLETLNFRVN